MRVNRNDIVVGHPIKIVRDFLRRHDRWSESTLAEFFNISLADARELAVSFVTEGFAVTQDNRAAQPYCITLKGGQLSSARLLKPISRSKADHLVMEFLNRVELVNARSELVERIVRVRAFGSYVTDNPDVGDIDLVVDRERKEHPGGMDWVDWNVERARISGKSVKNFVDLICYGSVEISQILKARCPYLSFHDEHDLEATKATTKLLWKAS